MAGTVHDLLGQIINPQPHGMRNPAPIAPMRVDAPLPELIGRIMAPPAPQTNTPAVPGIVAEVTESPLPPTG